MNAKRATRPVIVCVTGLLLGLLAVGLVSHTPLRHLVQALPGGVVLALLAARVPWAAAAALPVCIFWLAIMTLIWLFLLGLASVITGRFSPAEIAITLLIGACGAAGTVTSLRVRPRPSIPARLIAFVCSAIMQVAAMWLSLQPALAQS
jgi:hypothetical protein